MISKERLDGIRIQETIKDFSVKELIGIARGFQWVWKDVVGHSGGILMGFKTDLFEMEDSEVGEFYVSMVLRHRTRNFIWEMLTVYGPAHHDLLASFILELSRKCMYATLPLVMGGDFNLIRTASDKNNCNVNLGLMNMFNMFIGLHQLQKIRRSGSKYTWTNK
jgi:hypothetical protein